METAAEATTKIHPLRLRSVLIRRFRSVVPETELDFGPGPVFLLGRNGAGKTTLLELLARLISCDLAPFRKEEDPVDVEWVLEREAGDYARIRGLYTLTLHLVVMPGHLSEAYVDVEDSKRALISERPAPRWKFNGELKVLLQGREQPISRVRFSYADDGPATFDPPGGKRRRGEDGPPPSPFDGLFLLRLAVDFVSRVEEFASDDVIERGTSLMQMVQTIDCVRFDEALSAYMRIVGSAEDVVAIQQLHGGGVSLDFVPHDVLSEFMKEFASSLVFQAGSEVAGRSALQEIVEVLGAEKIELRPRLWEQDAKGKRTWRGFDLYVTWPGGVIHSHHQLSFGQKRIFAFLWYAFVYENAPLLTDELTNGLHASWVRRIVDLLQDKQAFHAVQNPLLVDMTGPGEEAEIPGRFVFCDVVRTDEGRQWRWRNPTPEEAHRLRAAFDAGFEGLSGILQSEGLW